MQTDLYLIRHGETATNRAHLIQPFDGEPLNARGRAQAERAAARLAGAGLRAIYTSPLARARETAAIIGAATGLEPVAVEGLRELRTGVVSGLHTTQFVVRHPRLWWQWLRDDPQLAFPQGEVLREFYARSRAAVEALVAAHRGEAIGVVAHGGVIGAYLSLLRGRGSNRLILALRNGAICHVRWEGGGPPQIPMLNDTRHLP